MRKVAVLAFVALGVLGVGAVATADNNDGSSNGGARLNGYQEVTSVSTTGFGSFHIKFNRNMTADYVLSYRDMDADVTQGHIHFAQRAGNGPIEVWLCHDGVPTGPNPPGPPARQPPDLPVCPLRSGTVRGTIIAGDIQGDGAPPADRGIEAGNWAEFKAAVKVGHTYANVHTTRFPGGEIRGQIDDRDQKEYTGPPPFVEHDDDDDDDD
jgi:CHRD domain